MKPAKEPRRIKTKPGKVTGAGGRYTKHSPKKAKGGSKGISAGGKGGDKGGGKGSRNRAGKEKGVGSGKKKGGGKGKGSEKGSGKGGGNAADGKRMAEAGGKKARKVSTIEEVPADGSTKGVKVKGKSDKKRKATDSGDESEDDDEPKKRGKKFLNAKKVARKEVTFLYNELINSTRDRKCDEIVNDILEVLNSRPDPLEDYCCKKIGSRVLQACLKWGSKAQRRQMLTSLQGALGMLAVDRYGHVVVQKLLVYIAKTSTARKPTKEESQAQAQNLKDFLKPFQGKELHGTFFHRCGCRVINSIYYSPVVSAQDKRRMLHDVAVPQVVALVRPEVPGSRTLRQLVKAEDLTEEQKKEVLDHLQELVEKSIDKELLGMDIAHLLFQAYCEVASEAQLKDLVDKAIAGAPHLLSSKPGTEAVLRLLGVANAKHKKAFCKDLKGKFAALASNAVDYLMVLRLCETVDDTVMMEKGLLAELVAGMSDLCLDKYGYRVLTWLLRPDDTRFFSPYERECLAVPAPTALKAPELRRQELLRVLRPPLRTALLAQPLKLMADTHAQHLLVAFLATEWDGELIEAILKGCKKEAATKDFGVLGTPAGTSALLALLKLEPEGSKDPFAMPLWEQCFKPSLLKLPASRCIWVLLALAKQGGVVRKAVLKEVKGQKKEVEIAAKEREAKGEVVTGIRQLLAAAAEA